MRPVEGPAPTLPSSAIVLALLVAYAASSLAESFREVASAYEAQHTGDRVELNLAGNQWPRTQIEPVAPADDRWNVVAEYPIATVTSSRVGEGTRAFVELVLGPLGQEILRRHGFAP